MKRLKDETNLESAITRLIMQIGNRVSAVKQGSLRRSVKRAQHLQQRRFPAAARTGDGKEFALRHAKIDASQSLHLTIIEFFCDPFGLEDVAQRVCGRQLSNVVAGLSKRLLMASEGSFSSSLALPFPAWLPCLFFSAPIDFQIFLGPPVHRRMEATSTNSSSRCQMIGRTLSPPVGAAVLPFTAAWP